MQQPTAKEIGEWITQYFAQILAVQPDEISPTTPFEDMGIDSTTAAGLSGDLETWLNVEFDIDIAFQLPTIDALAKYAASLLAENTSAG